LTLDPTTTIAVVALIFTGGARAVYFASKIGRLEQKVDDNSGRLKRIESKIDKHNGVVI